MAIEIKRRTIGLVARVIVGLGSLSPVAAQEAGSPFSEPYRYYADPGNGGGSAYDPFFDPYRGNRIVRGAYPDGYYDGRGYHYGKKTPPSLYTEPNE